MPPLPAPLAPGRLRRRLARLSPLSRLVLAVAAVGLLAQLLVASLAAGQAAVCRLPATGLGTVTGRPLELALLLATFASDWVSVRVRHSRSQVEELTLFEVAVVVDVLVLPALPALLLPVVATLLCSLVRRRDLVKVAFNVGNLAAAVAVLVGTVHLVSAAGAGLTARTVVGLTVGTLAFAAVNLGALALVLGVVSDTPPWQVVREGLRISVVLALGPMALGSTAVTLAWASPALLPFVLMPAGALLFAYRAAAQEAEERERSGLLLQLSQLLAGHLQADDLLGAFLGLVRQVFDADVALGVLADGGLTASDDRRGGASRRPAADEELTLLRSAADTGADVLRRGLPGGWTSALVAPLEAEGLRLGALVVARRDRARRLGPRELTLLTPTASALAVALRGSAHLRRVEEETGKLQAVVDQSSDGILVLDGAGAVQLWSPAVEALTGRAAAQALGRPLADVLTTRGADAGPSTPLVGRAELSPEAPEATVEVTVVRDDGEQRVVRCALAGAYGDDGALARVVVIVHDVTRERRVERLKADFIATVSHELRTPVTPITGYADLLRRRGHLMTPEKRQECLDVIVDRAAHLSRLVEDLLLASRMSATEGASPVQVELGPDDLTSLARRACGDFGAEGERVTVLLPDGPVPVSCDPVRVIQVLTNLVGNALKYSTPGTPVRVRLVVRDGTALVEVQDSGRGIPADQLERVFEKFHRVEDPMRMTTSGTGLGLYIARQLATAMGGALDCTSTLNIGSVFRFSLPLAVPAPRAPEPAAGPAAPAPRRGFVRPAELAGPDGGPARLGRHTPPWAVPPPRPAGAHPSQAPQPLG